MLAKCPLQILAKCPWAKCPLAKCPLAKCPLAKWIYNDTSFPIYGDFLDNW